MTKKLNYEQKRKSPKKIGYEQSEILGTKLSISMPLNIESVKRVVFEMSILVLDLFIFFKICFQMVLFSDSIKILSLSVLRLTNIFFGHAEDITMLQSVNRQ